MQRIGLIAGNGSFPGLFIREAHIKGCEVFTVALSGEAEKNLVAESDRIEWSNIGKVGKIIGALKAAGIKEACLCGQVKHSKLFTEIKLDLVAVKLLALAKDRRADSILGLFCDELEQKGVKVLSSLTFLEKYTVKPGPMTKNVPAQKIKKDIEFGHKIATEIARLDIGQTVVVKSAAVIAVEGFEGTDECLRRAGKYAGTGTVLIKVARPKQDMRYDVPVFGPGTVETMKETGCGTAALTEGKTLIIEYEKTLALADKYGFSIVGI